MNAKIVLFFLAAVVLAVVSAFPAVDIQEEESVVEKDLEGVVFDVLPDDVVEEPDHVRERRATCDLLSVSTPIGSLNHAACAAHCLAMRRGYRGGRCRDGVCHCRR